MAHITVGGCKVTKTAVGGCTHFITTPLFGGKTQSIGWGQGALYGGKIALPAHI